MRKKAISKNDAALQPSSEQFGRGETKWLKVACGARKNERTENKKEAERRQTRVSLLHLPAKRAPCAGRARLSAF
ncbi:MAG: hypothetical protein WAV27_18645, partial [Xanthobacteraceae bacterium]